MASRPVMLVFLATISSCSGASATDAGPPLDGSGAGPPAPSGQPRGGRISLPKRPPDQHDPGGAQASPVARPPRTPRHGLTPRAPQNPPPPLRVPHSVGCGAAVCDPQKVPGLGILLQPCCLDASAGTCGFAAGMQPDAECLPVTDPAQPNPSCPKGDAVGIPGLVLEGCCRSTGKCGYVLSFDGGPSLGCIAPAQVGAARPETACQ